MGARNNFGDTNPHRRGGEASLVDFPVRLSNLGDITSGGGIYPGAGTSDEDVARGDMAPGDIEPSDIEPGDMEPGDMGDMYPGVGTPDEDMALGDMAPGSMARGNMATGDRVPGDTASRATAVETLAWEGSVPLDALSGSSWKLPASSSEGATSFSCENSQSPVVLSSKVPRVTPGDRKSLYFW